MLLRGAQSADFSGVFPCDQKPALRRYSKRLGGLLKNTRPEIECDVDPTKSLSSTDFMPLTVEAA